MDSEKTGKIIRDTSIVILALIVVAALVVFLKNHNQPEQVQVPRPQELSQQELSDKITSPTPNLNPKISPALIKSLSSTKK